MSMSLLVKYLVPTNVICVSNKKIPGFNEDGMHSTSSRTLTHLRWTRDHSRVYGDKFVHYQRRASVVYAEAGRQFV